MKRTELARIVDDVLGRVDFVAPVTAEDMLDLYNLLRPKLTDYLLDISHRNDDITLLVHDNTGIVLRRKLKPQ